MHARLHVRRFAGTAPPLVALHGFTQTGAMFEELAGLLGRELLAPDLPGHGRSADVATSFSSAVAGVVEVLAALLEPAPLIGYSQGGRVALGATLDRPELISHLVIVSATPGIANAAARAERLRRDERRGAELRTIGVAPFVERWLSGPLFAGLQRRGTAWREADKAARLENTAEGLGAALAGMGQGAQPYLGDLLPELRVPTLLIAGRHDRKYASIAAAMRQALPDASLRIVPDAGHAVIGEQPRMVADLVTEFLAGRVR